MDRHRISASIPIAIAYADRTDNYLRVVIDPMNGVRLGLTTDELAEWHSKRLAIDECGLKWNDISQKTTAVNTLMVRLLGEFREFANPILDRIAASASLNETDEVVFNLVGDAHHADPTHRETSITDHCNNDLKAIGGGEVAHHVHPDGDSKRNHILAGSTGYEVAFTITGKPTELTDPENSISKSFTKADSIQKLGVINKGRYINHCTRWLYSPHEEFNGPFNESKSDLIH